VPVFAPNPQTYFVGTDPVNVTIQDINGDTVPDLVVANRGSNDVSILFGSWDSITGNWMATPGPRLQSGGFGPIAVNVVPDPHSPGGADLAITNGTSGTIAVLPGRGQGFFDGRNPQVLDIPGNPVIAQGPVFAGSSDAGVVLTGAGQIVGFNLGNFAATAGTVFTPPPGEPVLVMQGLPDGNLVVAEQGGTVAILQQGPGALFEPVQTLVPLTGIPSNPSALIVLGDEVLVTDAGSDQIFVYEPPATFLPEQSIALPALVTGVPTPETTSPGTAPLAAVVTLTVFLVPPGTTGTTEFVVEGGTFPAGSEAAGNAGESAGSAPSTTPIQGADDDKEEQAPDDTATPESNFGLGIEEKLRQLKPQKKEDQPDGPSSQRSPLEFLPGEALADFWQEADADWLTEVPLDSWPEAGEAPFLPATSGAAGGSALTAFSDNAGATVSLDWPDEVLAVVRATAACRDGAGSQETGGNSWADPDAAPVTVRLPARDGEAEEAVLAALAMGGLACWIERSENEKTAPAWRS
jgi:hypothetical protein